MFLNPDVVPDPGSIEQLDQILTRGARLGAVGGRLRFPDGTFQPSCRHFPTIGNLLFSRGSILGRLLGRSERYTLPDSEELTAVPAVAGTMMMLRADLFRRFEGFDRRFFMYMEDTDLCFRLDRRGFSNLFAPGAGGVHAWTTGSDASHVQRAWWHHNSLRSYFLKHMPNFVSLLILPVLLMIHLGLVIALGRKPVQEAKHGK
jgi:GT2 family glycosyltransferase